VNRPPDAHPRGLCALAAQQSVEAIGGAVPLLQGGRTCTLRLYQGMSQANGNQGVGYDGGSSIACTGLHSLYGSRPDCTDLLPNALEALARISEADLFVVLTGCPAELIGDDVAGEVRRFREKGWPVVHADLAGFSGDAWSGHERLCRALVDQHVSETFEQDERLVNLWGPVPYLDPHWEGDLLELSRLLSGLGLVVNPLFGCGSSVAAWKRIPSAALNLVVSPWLGTALCHHLRERFGTPSLQVAVPPVGRAATESFLRAVAAVLPVDPLRLDAFLASEEAIFSRFLEKGSDLFLRHDERAPERFHLVADSYVALGLHRFLACEMGLPAGVVILIDRPRHGREALLELFRSAGKRAGEISFADGTDIAEVLRERLSRESGRAIVLGSLWDEPLARELGAAFLPVSAPLGDLLVLDRSYLGMRGALRLLEDLWGAVLS